MKYLPWSMAPSLIVLSLNPSNIPSESPEADKISTQKKKKNRLKLTTSSNETCPQFLGCAILGLRNLVSLSLEGI
jgi:hypothetical protein